MMTKTLGLYIHIPFCRSKCGYCDFYSMTSRLDEIYIRALVREIEMRSPDFKDRTCDTVYFGGGTPSLLSEEMVRKIMHALRAHFHISSDAEITMEMNPCDMSEEYLLSVKDAGINRISVGAQSHNDRLLRILGRQHTAKDAEKAIRRAYKAGIHNISLDLMYELPGQSVEDFEDSLHWTVHLPVNHMSVYSLILEEGTRFYSLLEKGRLPRPTELESWKMYQDMCRILPNYGFERYEISSFARKGYRSRHNMKYWLFDDYLGLGPAACSRIGHDRIENLPRLRMYEKELLTGHLPPMEVDHLSESEDMEEYCFMHLRMKEGFNRYRFQERYGEMPEKWYGKQMDFLKKKKLIKEENGQIHMTPHGTAIGNYVFEQFLRD